MRYTFILFAFLLAVCAMGQKAVNKNLKGTDSVVTNEVDAAAFQALTNLSLSVESKITTATNSMATKAWVNQNKNYHWDSYSGILWESVVSNGYWYVIAITNTPAIGGAQ